MFICPASSAFSPSPLLRCDFKDRKRDFGLGVAKFGRTGLARHFWNLFHLAVRLRDRKKEKFQFTKMAF